MVTLPIDIITSHHTQHIDIAVKKRELQTVETELLTCTSIQDDRSTSCDPRPPSDDELVLHTRTSPDNAALCSDPQIQMVVQSTGNERGSTKHQDTSHPQSATAGSRRNVSSSQWELSQRAKTLTSASDTRKVRPPPSVHGDLAEEEDEGTEHTATRGPEKGLKKQRRAAHKEERNKANQAPVVPIDYRPSNQIVDRPLKRVFANPIVRQSNSQATASHLAEYQQNNNNKKMPHHSPAAQQGKDKNIFDGRAMLEKDSTGPPSRKAGRGGGRGRSTRLEPLRKQPAPPAAAKKVSPGDWFLEDDTPW
jgi:hypothetical protein